MSMVGFAAAALLTLSSCGGRTNEPESICARARILPIDPFMVTPSGRVLESRASGWAVSQLEADGTLTPVTTLETSEFAVFVRAWLEHDPSSGRMWVLEGSDWLSDKPTTLYQFDADGQLEWEIPLVDYERPVDAGSLHFHEDSLYVALTMERAAPADPSEPGAPKSLVIERRDLNGAMLWSRADYGPPQTSDVLASAVLVDVAGSALSMVVTPPLIDYGPSYPLTVDIETGDVLWSGSDGHAPLRMAVSDAQLYLGWVTPRSYDPERWPEKVVLAHTSSSLSVHAPSTGAQANLEAVDWSAIDWRYPGVGRETYAMGWMGARLVSVVVAAGEHGVTVHDADGTLLCQGALDIEFDAVHRGMGIDGRSQFVAGVSVGLGDADDAEEEHGLLLIEPLTND